MMLRQYLQGSRTPDAIALTPTAWYTWMGSVTVPAGCNVSLLELSYLHKVEAGQQSDALFAHAGFKSLFGRHDEVPSVSCGYFC